MAVKIKNFSCVCGWSGWKPDYILVKKPDKVEQLTFICPDCRAFDIREEK